MGKRSVRVLLNLAPLLLGVCLFPIGGFGIVAVMVFQTVLAFLNFWYAQRVLETFLLNLLMGVSALAGGFLSGVLYLIFVSDDSMVTLVLATLMAADLLYSLMLLLVSTLWSGARRSQGRTRRILRFLSALALGGLLGCAAITAKNLTGRTPAIFMVLDQLSLPAFLGVALVSIPVITLLHELGHLVFGLAAGYRFHAFRLGPLAWSRENGRTVLRVQAVAGLSGACGLLPPPEARGKGRTLFFLAGGILANLLTALLALFLPLIGAARAVAQLFALFSLLAAFFNALPLYSAGNPSDGRQFWVLLLGTAEGERQSAYLRQTQQLMAGVRPRELDPLPPPPQAPLGADLRARMVGEYFRRLDGGDGPGAGAELAFLETRIEEFPSIALSALYYELCFFACTQGELERAAGFRAKAQPGLDQDGDLNGLRVRAACAWYLDGDAAQARALCTQALAVEKSFPIPGQARMEHDLVENLLAALPPEGQE